jgi:sigma-B regulation protein RsbQ
MDVIQRNHVLQQLHTIQSAPVLLYAHGFGCNQAMWAQLTPEFAASHRQVLFDYVGSGQSDAHAFDPNRYGSLQGYVQDLIDVCDALPLEREVIFVGHSVSCSIGILASIQRPELFSHMILVGPSPCFLNIPPDYMGGFERADLEGLLELMDQNYLGWAQYFAPVVAGTTLTQPLVTKLSNSFCSTDPVMARLFAKVTFFSDIRDQLQHCTTPCLILQHQNDALAPLSVGDYLHQHLTGSTLEILEVSGHCAHMSHPDLVADSIRKYLSGRDSRVLP